MISASVGLLGLGLLGLGILEVPNPGMPGVPALASAPPVGSLPVILAEQQAAASSPAPPLPLAVPGLILPAAIKTASAPSKSTASTPATGSRSGTALASPGGITLAPAPSVTVTVPATPVTPPITVPITIPVTLPSISVGP